MGHDAAEDKGAGRAATDRRARSLAGRQPRPPSDTESRRRSGRHSLDWVRVCVDTRWHAWLLGAPAGLLECSPALLTSADTRLIRAHKTGNSLRTCTCDVCACVWVRVLPNL